MDERYRLIRAIEAEPDDDLPRLVFADWLEEHGDEARARFIRLQCEFERHFPDAAPEARTEEEARLRREIDGLLAAHRAEWEAGLPSLARGVDFRRGFPHIWFLSGEQFAEGAEAIRAVAPLPSLRLHWLKGHEAAVLGSPHLAGLSALSMPAAQLTDASIEILLANPHLGRLCRLTLDRAHFGGTSNYENKLTDAACVMLCSGLPALASLSLQGHEGITPAGVRALLEAEARSGLAELDLSHIAGGPALAEAFHTPGFRLRALRHLSLNNCGLGDAGAAALAAAPALGGLAHLRLARNNIGDEGTLALAGSPHLARLEGLDLWTNRLGDAGARAIAGSPHLAGLRALEMGENPSVTDAGARALLDSRRWERLGLEGTGASMEVRVEAGWEGPY